MKRRLTIGIRLLSVFAFFATFLLGTSISSVAQGFWRGALPFIGIAIFLMFLMSGKSFCRSKRNC